jgi:TIR domain
MAHDVFISHSAKDKTTADTVCAMLESEGIRCWIAPRDVLPSMEWGEAIIDAIEECRIMVLVFTANANASPQIRREVERAVNHGVAILPLRVEDVLPAKSLEYFIGNVHWLDAQTPPFEAHLRNLAGTIKIVLERMEPREAPPVRPAITREAPEGVKPPGPTVAPSAQPAVTPTLPQEEKPEPNGGGRLEEGTPEKGSDRGGEATPRRFWSTRAWTWAAGTVSVLLLGAVFVGVRSVWGPTPTGQPTPVGLPAAAPMPGSAPSPESTPLPATGPAGPAASPLPTPTATPSAHKTAKSAAKDLGSTVDNAALQATMRNIQEELSSIGTVSFTAFFKNKINGSSLQAAYVQQVGNVVADPAQCRVSYHWRWRVNGAAQEDLDAGFLLEDVTSVVVEPMSQQENNTNSVPTSTAPPVTVLIVGWPVGADVFPFTDAALAHRAAETLTEAVKLCGGQLAK